MVVIFVVVVLHLPCCVFWGPDPVYYIVEIDANDPACDVEWNMFLLQQSNLASVVFVHLQAVISNIVCVLFAQKNPKQKEKM